MIFSPREPLVFSLALFFSVIQITLVAVSMPHTSIAIKNPLAELVIPLMFEGYLAESWPMWLGLSNSIAMLIYFIVSGLMVYLVWRLARKKDGDKIEDAPWRLMRKKEGKGIKGEVIRNVDDIRKHLNIRNRKIALPIVGWLLIIAFMLNTSHTVPPKTVQHYQERLLYTLGARDVIHYQVDFLAREFRKNRSQTVGSKEDEFQPNDKDNETR
jgi:hypothetical protein